MKLAAFTVMLPTMAPEEAVQELQSAGYDGVEWRVTSIDDEIRKQEPSFWGNNLCTLACNESEANRARRLTESVGLAVSNLGTYVMVDDLVGVEGAMRFAQIAGAPSIRVRVASIEGSTYARRIAEARAHLSEIEEMARARHIRALVEIHHRTICSSASSAFHLISPFDPEVLGIIYDPGNMVYEGFEDYQLGLELIQPYLAHVHIKNAAYLRPHGGGVWAPCWAPLEDGVVDFPRFFAALRSVGYNGWLSLEDFDTTCSARKSLHHGIAFIKNTLQLTVMH
jgi:sugar phosphate isomerase/epimerase